MKNNIWGHLADDNTLVTADHRDDFLIWKVMFALLRLMITCLTGMKPSQTNVRTFGK